MWLNIVYMMNVKEVVNSDYNKLFSNIFRGPVWEKIFIFDIKQPLTLIIETLIQRNNLNLN